jgi:hypothetical protein
MVAAAVSMQACSSVSKETYTEKRTLTYPKGGVPHVKEMYLRNDPPDQQNTYIGSSQPRAVTPVVNNYQGDWNYVNPDLPQKSLEDINYENQLLAAKVYNKWLSQRQ